MRFKFLFFISIFIIYCGNNLPSKKQAENDLVSEIIPNISEYSHHKYQGQFSLNKENETGYGYKIYTTNSDSIFVKLTYSLYIRNKFYKKIAI